MAGAGELIIPKKGMGSTTYDKYGFPFKVNKRVFLPQTF